MKPNIVLMMSDQQRWDTLGCLGYRHVITANLDSLARRGVCFSHAFVQGALCAPSRASIVCGKYVHTHGAENNGLWLLDREPNWVEELRGAGYHTANIGKMHAAPIRLSCGFDYRLVVENKNYKPTPPDGPDDYDLFLKDRGLSRPANLYPDTVQDWWDQLQTVIWPLDEELYPDNFIGQRAVDYLGQHDFRAPLFLWVGFIGPHDPYDVPASVLERYAGVEIPDPVGYPGELDDKPPQQLEGMKKMDGMRTQAAVWWSRATPDKIRRMRRHYYANVTVIDDWVGRIVETVRDLGQLDNTIFIFTSDHGDCLGDHHQIYKFISHYDSVVRVPLIFAGPGIEARGVRDQMVELIDLGPTVLALAGLEPRAKCEGRSFDSILQGNGGEFRDAVFSEHTNRAMVRTRRWKLVFYHGTPHGELYDVEQDPDELHNLWNAAEGTQIRHQLQERLLHWYARTRFVNRW